MLSAGVDHVSAYALIVEDGTALARKVRRGELPAPDDDVLASRYERIDARLAEAGLTWYEVSNWASADAATGESRCRHNLGYWDGGDWWGAGPGAHSHVGGVRWWNVKHPARYADQLAVGSLPVGGSEELTAEDVHVERVMLTARLRTGLPVAELDARGAARGRDGGGRRTARARGRAPGADRPWAAPRRRRGPDGAALTLSPRPPSPRPLSPRNLRP